MKLKPSTLTVVLTIALIALVIAAGVLTQTSRLLAQNSPAQANANQSSTDQPSQAALVREYLDGMQKLRGTDLTPEARAQLQAEMAQKRAQLRDLRRQTRLARGILPFGPPPGGGAKRTAPATAASGDGQKLQSAQRCEACKAIMGNVADLASKKFIQDVQAAFEQACGNAQKSTIYYNVCEDMYDDMYAMTDDYMSQASKVCFNAKFCNYQ